MQDASNTETTTLAVVAADASGRTAEVRFELSVVRCPGWRYLRISSVANANDLRVCSIWYNQQASSLVQWMQPDGSFLNILEVSQPPSLTTSLWVLLWLCSVRGSRWCVEVNRSCRNAHVSVLAFNALLHI